jgi:hypothetical protein
VFSEDDLIAARDAGLLSEDDYLALVAFLYMRRHDMPVREHKEFRAPSVRFDLTHVLWYAGALIIIVAMGLFTTEAFNRMGGSALMMTALAYGAGFLMLGHYLWYQRDLRTPGGLAVTVAVAMVPMAVYGLEDMLGIWASGAPRPGIYRDFFPYINASWVYMELATIIAAVLALRAYPFPFITMIAAVALWFMSMDIAGWFAKDHAATFALQRDVSLWFGLGVIVVAWIIDVVWRSRGNFAFWLHLAGAAAFWGGLTFRESATEFVAFAYFLTNIGLVLFSLFIDRRIYAIFGAQGIAFYLGHLAYDVFADALLFSFALSAIGLMIIGLGLRVHNSRHSINRFLNEKIPWPLRALRPAPSLE